MAAGICTNGHDLAEEFTLKCPTCGAPSVALVKRSRAKALRRALIALAGGVVVLAIGLFFAKAASDSTEDERTRSSEQVFALIVTAGGLLTALGALVQLVRLPSAGATVKQEGQEIVAKARREKIEAQKAAGDVNSLVTGLRSEEPEVRTQTAVALGNLGDVTALQPLLQALTDPETSVRAAAATALGRLKDPSAVDPLMAGLRDAEPAVRRASAGALGVVGDARATGPLLDAAVDQNMMVSGGAGMALRALGGGAVEPLIAALGSGDEARQVVAADCLGYGYPKDPRTLEPLLSALTAAAPSVRLAAAKALGNVEDPRAAEPLAAALASDIPALRHRAAIALAGCGDRRALEPLVASLQEDATRADAADALGKLGDRRALEPLRAAHAVASKQKRRGNANAPYQLKRLDAAMKRLETP